MIMTLVIIILYQSRSYIKLELVVIVANECRVGKYGKELSTAIIIVTIE